MATNTRKRRKSSFTPNSVVQIIKKKNDSQSIFTISLSYTFLSTLKFLLKNKERNHVSIRLNWNCLVITDKGETTLSKKIQMVHLVRKLFLN